MSDNRLSLYFELADGEKADLEIVASAAIAWVEAIRAAAQAYDPGTDVKVELVDADESSLIFNTLLEWFDRKVGKNLERTEAGWDRLPRGRKLALGLVAFIGITGIPTYDFYFGEDDKLSEEDRAWIEDLVDRTQGDPAVETAKRKFYRTLEREPAIKAVGVSESPRGRPLAMVPSDAFPTAGGLWQEMDGDIQERVITSVLDVVLVKPALVHTPRSWTFKPDGLPEFEAVMRDGRVLQAIRDSGFPETLREGIPMTIRLEVREVMVGGQWKAVRGGRSAMRVLSPKIGD